MAQGRHFLQKAGFIFGLAGEKPVSGKRQEGAPCEAGPLR